MGNSVIAGPNSCLGSYSYNSTTAGGFGTWQRCNNSPSNIIAQASVSYTAATAIITATASSTYLSSRCTGCSTVQACTNQPFGSGCNGIFQTSCNFRRTCTCNPCGTVNLIDATFTITSGINGGRSCAAARGLVRPSRGRIQVPGIDFNAGAGIEEAIRSSRGSDCSDCGQGLGGRAF